MLPQGWCEEALHSPEQNAPGTWEPAWLCHQTQHISRWLKSQWLQVVLEDSKGFDKHRLSILRMQKDPLGGGWQRGVDRVPTEPDKFAQQLARPKMSPEKPEPAFTVAKSILDSSVPQMYLSRALHSTRY